MTRGGDQVGAAEELVQVGAADAAEGGGDLGAAVDGLERSFRGMEVELGTSRKMEQRKERRITGMGEVYSRCGQSIALECHVP